MEQQQEQTLFEQLATVTNHSNSLRVQSEALAGQFDRLQRSIADTLEDRSKAPTACSDSQAQDTAKQAAEPVN